VLINTGDLVRRLRAATEGPAANRVWTFAAGHWSGATRAASTALTGAALVPGPVPVALSRLGRAVAGAEQVPLYDAGLSRGGEQRRPITDTGADAVFFAACVGTMFGGGVSAAVRDLCARAGVRLRTPGDVDGLCCGTPWKSKGHLDGYARMSERVRASVLAATEHGRLPLVVDASSCTEGLVQMLADSGVEVRDATEFVAERVLPGLTLTAPVPAVVVHPTCSSTAGGSTDALVQLAGFVSDDVTVPVAWGCCGFAGDRGLLHPELTAAATAPEASEVSALGSPAGTAYVSCNRTCEIGMARATGEDYRHVLEILEEATR
jgi:D-lactate dehydrogenase